MIVKIKLDTKIRHYYLESGSYYSMISIKQFLEYFLPNNNFDYIIVEDDSEKPDITIWDIQLADNSLLKEDEINMLISVEHLNYWGHYHHYNNYGDYGDSKIKIYIYNHITKVIIDSNNNFIAIPMIYNFINYYLDNHMTIKPSIYIDFEDKKFCLMVNKSNLNSEIRDYVDILSEIGEIDNINLYNEYIGNKSCYHSIELLNILNQYKFILCFENSYGNGYITEKIFNTFFAKSIPIYKGSPIIFDYINRESFISLEHTTETDIRNISHCHETFNHIINQNKISSIYTDEDYKNKLSQFILEHGDGSSR